MRGDEAIAADPRVMADVIAAPEHDVIAERDERLDDVVLEDEAMLSDPRVVPDHRLRADERCRCIASRLQHLIQARTEPVALGVNGRRIKRMFAGRKMVFEVFHRHDRFAE
jgi:hypothetical protein